MTDGTVPFEMSRRPLNLHALRAFEAAARHGSFKDAAAELGVTPVAVTRHIKRLELELGVTLFERLHRGVRLSDAGRDLSDEVIPAFAALDVGVERVGVRSGRLTLHIGCDSAFAKCWLMRRLDGFHERHPDIHIDLKAQDESEEFDGLIFYGSRQRFGRDRHLLFSEVLFPMCAPSLIGGPVPLVRPADLAEHCLLHDDSDDWWQRWFEAAGMRGIKERGTEIFFSHDRLYQAALEGRGVLMGDAMVYGDDLTEGRFVRLFSETIVGNQFILAVRTSSQRPALNIFVAWLLSECEAHKTYMKNVLGL